jgi:hypothetical protein
MTTLRASSKKEKSGKMNSPYDSKLHNTYRLGFETGDIRQFHVTLTITGRAQDQFNARVWEQSERKEVVLDKKDVKVKPGETFTLQGKLPKPLTIQRQKNGCDYNFNYAKSTDGARWYAFSTLDEGFGLAKYKVKKGKPSKGAAQKTERICDQSTTAGKNPGTVIGCSFPGW